MISRSGTDPEQGLSLSYDFENRLVEGSVPERGLTLSYSYDPFGKRLSKTVDGTTKYYFYDNEDIIVEYDSVGSLTASYLHGQGIDEPISSSLPDLIGQSMIYYTFDGLGSVVELTDGSGNVVESYKYDSFGNIETPPATGNPYAYTGREYDSESGLYYYRARYYDAAVGRFLSEDPIFFRSPFFPAFSILSNKTKTPVDFNYYVYALNNPINKIDPFGLISCKCGEEAVLDKRLYGECLGVCISFCFVFLTSACTLCLKAGGPAAGHCAAICIGASGAICVIGCAVVCYQDSLRCKPKGGA